MNDEIRKAAERFSKWRAAEPFSQDFPSSKQASLDCIALADWAVQELAAREAAETEEGKDLRARILAMMQQRGWSTHWIHRTAYLHLEAAELAEAVRGKHGSPLEESGDVLITLLALSPYTLPEIVEAAEAKVAKLETCPVYSHEERTEALGKEGAK